MKAIILAAGRGSRMAESTARMPKCAMQLFGKRLIDHCVDSLLAAGFARADIGIVTGYRANQARVEGLHSFHNGAWRSTNMVASLACAGKWLAQDTCIVCYSDIIFHPSVIARMIASEGDIIVPYYTQFWALWSKRFADPLQDLETFKVAQDRLLEIGCRAEHRSQIDGQYMGLLRFSPEGWRRVAEVLEQAPPQPLAKLDMTTLLQYLITRGLEIRGFPTDEPWLECDNQNDVELYEREFASCFEPVIAQL
jgi:L-glutamine-phosphate cytidylyltransferase